jgi:hypothetical protein
MRSNPDSGQGKTGVGGDDATDGMAWKHLPVHHILGASGRAVLVVLMADSYCSQKIINCGMSVRFLLTVAHSRS